MFCNLNIKYFIFKMTICKSCFHELNFLNKVYFDNLNFKNKVYHYCYDCFNELNILKINEYKNKLLNVEYIDEFKKILLLEIPNKINHDVNIFYYQNGYINNNYLNKDENSYNEIIFKLNKLIENENDLDIMKNKFKNIINYYFTPL
jgi:hypothetical protein